MARLDKSRDRVLCDDYGLCRTELAIVQEEAGVGRVLYLRWGWRKRNGLLTYQTPRRPAPPSVTGLARGTWHYWQAPMLGFPGGQRVLCPGCRREQLLDPVALDVVPIHEIAGRVVSDPNLHSAAVYTPGQ